MFLGRRGMISYCLTLEMVSEILYVLSLAPLSKWTAYLCASAHNFKVNP
jgi:hypothetical protein